MKQIALIGFNIFGTGGTSQSNINLIEEFTEAEYAVSFYNYIPFAKRDLRHLKNNIQSTTTVDFFQFNHLDQIGNPDYIFITREDFFCLAPYVRRISNAKIIGEIHAPLPMIDQAMLKQYLPYMSFVRVATKSIQVQIELHYDYHRVFAQTVSLKHVSVSEHEYETSLIDADGHVNFAVRARFDDVKDIPYAIKLMNHLVNDLGHHNFRLYITGSGAEGNGYRELIQKFSLSSNVIMNGETPAVHVYLSTSKMETFGYSIIEEFSLGHPVIMYPGDDGVLKENFGQFRDCAWITKKAKKDAEIVAQFVQSHHSEADYLFNLSLIRQLKANYVDKFEANTSGANLASREQVDDVTLKDALHAVRNGMQLDKMYYLRHAYYAVKKIPLVGALLSQSGFRRLGINIVGALRGKMRK